MDRLAFLVTPFPNGKQSASGVYPYVPCNPIFGPRAGDESPLVVLRFDSASAADLATLTRDPVIRRLAENAVLPALDSAAAVVAHGEFQPRQPAGEYPKVASRRVRRRWHRL